MSEEKAFESPASAEKQRAPFETGDISRAKPVWHKFVAVPAIIILALALRVMFTVQVERSAVPDLSRVKDLIDNGAGSAVQARDDGTDMEKHDYIARWVLRNGWYEKSADVSPLYAYAVLPGLYAVTGTDIYRTLLVQAALDTVTVLLIYLLALKLYGRRAAVYAGLAAAVYAPFIVYQGQLLGEWATNLLVAAFVLTALGFGEKTSLKRAAAGGVLFGLAVAAKPTVMVLAAPALFLLWWRGGRRWRVTLAPAGVAAAAALVAILPFTWRNYKAVGEFHLVRGNSGIMLYMGNNPSASGAFGYPRGKEADELEARTVGMTLGEKDKAYQRAALDFVVRNPGKFARLLWRKFGLFFSADEVPNNLSVKLYRQKTFLGSWAFLSFGAILPLSAAGMLFSLRRRGVLFVAGVSAMYAAAVIFFVVVGRYRLAVLPLLLPAAGFAVAEAVVAFKELKLARTLGILAVALAVAVPVNWMRLRLFTARALNPSGFVAVRGATVTIRDDSDYATPFGVRTIYEESLVTKFLIIDEPPSGLTGAAVAVRLAVADAGELEVKLNGQMRRVVLEESGRRWIRVDFGPEAVAQGTNTVTLRGDGKLQAIIYADDAYNFGRSLYSPDGKIWIKDELDRTTYRRKPALHMGGHEFKIRLELDYGGHFVPS